MRTLAPFLSLLLSTGFPSSFKARSASLTSLYSRSFVSSTTSQTTMYENKQNEDDICDVFIVPMWTDNYGYIVQDRITKDAAAVDPGDPQAMLNAAKSLGININQLWITHKHNDHVGGNVELVNNIPNLAVYGTRYEHIPAITNPCGEGDSFRLGNLMVKVLYTPCHTAGHVSFYVEPPSSSSSSPLLFPGDTLFVVSPIIITSKKHNLSFTGRLR